MPLLRYDAEDVVELVDEPCACGWLLPRIRVLGRATSMVSVAGRALRQIDVDDVVYRLPKHLRVLFWQGVATAGRLDLQVEVEPEHAEEATALLREEAPSALHVPVEVRAVALGSLVPTQLLRQENRFVKPRFLYPADEARKSGMIYQK
jgi:phenylacetate-CoA ligase